MTLASRNIERATRRLEVDSEDGADAPGLTGDVDERLGLADRYLTEGRGSMALRVLDPLADEHPEHSGVRLLRGRALSSVGRHREARIDLELSLAASPGDAAVLEALGRMYMYSGDQARALYFLSRYLDRVDPAGSKKDLGSTREIVGRLRTSQ